jgi:LAO/AO transport system kinase
MHETIQEYLKRNFYDHPEIAEKLKVLENYVLNDKMSSFIAAGELLAMYSKIKE